MPSIEPSKDFTEVKGRRLRIAVYVYQPGTRQFRYVKGLAARLTVKNVAEQNRLWKEIEAVIEASTRRTEAADADGSPDADGAGVGS